MSRRDSPWVVGLLAVAGYYVSVLHAASFHPGMPAFDTYQYYLPLMLQAARSLFAGGHGLLWNPYNHCGQPFLGISSTGLLYPPNALFLLLPPTHALLAVLFLHFAVAGVSAYAYGREIGLQRVGAFAGALAFQLGGGMLTVGTWAPFVAAPYAWLPAAMLVCERLIREPTIRGGGALGVFLALMLLPGFPQTVFFAYQLLALRVAWALVVRETRRPLWTLGMIGVGMATGPLLAAVALVPGLEAAMLSVRGKALSLNEVQSGITFDSWRGLFAWRREVNNPITVVATVLGFAGLLALRQWRIAGFYLAAGALFFALALGTSTPLFALYSSLPLGRLFRMPNRFLWMTSFCLAVLTGLGVDMILTPARAGGRLLRSAAMVVVVFVGSAGLWALSPSALLPVERWLVAIVAAAAVVGSLGSARVVAAAAILGALVIDLAIVRPIPYLSLLPDAGVLYAHADTFVRLRARMTSQDRIFVVPEHLDFSFMRKTPALFGLPAVQDYEPQPTQRSAAYMVMMRVGHPMGTLNDYYINLGGMAPPQVRRKLANLAAARYVVAAGPPTAMLGMTAAEVVEIPGLGGLRVFENHSALPRALYVPQLTVVPAADTVLAQLAEGAHDPRRVALVESPPASGFLGEQGNVATGGVAFVRDDPEHLVLRVTAPARGFLVLADQYYPGWRASVNGAPAEILRANYLFRAVEVPAGESVVEFRFLPSSVRVGAALSILTLGTLVLLIAWPRLLRRARPGIRPRGSPRNATQATSATA